MFRELFPAKICFYVDEAVLDFERLEAAPLIAELMKRIAAAGVGTRVFLRTYHTARSRSYYAVPALIYNEIEAKPRTTPFRTATSRSYVGLAVWEDVSITASMKAR